MMMLQAVVDIGGNLSPTIPTDLGLIIGRFAGFALYAASAATFGYLVYGGVNWVLSGGDKGKVEAAQKMITHAIIGLGIVAASFAIMSVLQFLFGIDIIGTRGASGGTGGIGGTGGGGTSQGVCSGGVSIGSTVSDGGAGGYCRTGTANSPARVNCVDAGVGPSGFQYPHYEPCGCEAGGTRVAGYTFMSCYQ